MILCFGELLLRLGAPGQEQLLQTSELKVHIGGAEANVAVGLAHLGHTVAMASVVPDNPLGHAAVRYLRQFAVDCTRVTFARGRMGLYFLETGAGVRPSRVVYDREQSSFALTSASSLDAARLQRLLTGVNRLHLSGITPALGTNSVELVLALAQAATERRIPISFDGNFRAQLWARWSADPAPILHRLISMADVLFGNHRDIALVLGREFTGEGSARDEAANSAAFAAFPHLQLIASTDREVVSADQHVLRARVQSRARTEVTEAFALSGIVDRIGAGDAFAAGVLSALLSGRNEAAMASDGIALACLKHTLPGDASLFSRADIDAFHAGASDVKR